MASIVTQLRAGQADVHHRGYDLKEVKFPSYIPDVAAAIFNKEELLKVLEENNITLNILHLGLSEYLVKWRASVRPSDTNEKPKNIWEEEEEARARGAKFVPSLLPNPDEAKTSKGVSKAITEQNRKLVISMAQVGIPWEQVEKALENVGAEAEDYKGIFDRALEG